MLSGVCAVYNFMAGSTLGQKPTHQPVSDFDKQKWPKVMTRSFAPSLFRSWVNFLLTNTKDSVEKGQEPFRGINLQLFPDSSTLAKLLC